MIHTMAITKDHQFINDAPLETIKNNTYDWYWVDFDCPTPDEEQLLASFFHFHPLAIEDCLQQLQRPKLDFYDDFHFFVIHSINKETLFAEEINIFIHENFIVTFHKNALSEMGKVKKLIQSKPKSWDRGPIYVMYQMIDKIVDSYFPLVYKIEDYLNALEDALTYQNNLQSMKLVLEFRSDLLQLRRTILPMRDLLYRIITSYRFRLKKSERAYFEDIHDHLMKLTDMIESNREMTADMRDSYMALNSNRMNGIMMILTIVSTIFIPLTFIAGVYGMNFHFMPELDGKYNYFIVLIVMFVIAVAMLVLFKVKGWFIFFKM
ncbi:magnesium/cobalt transporter CorA [Caryophanon tenue]|uniref:Magnesium transport protein CorA n=1 Tax=Caryophanon tenue TaxID=33978 RepID=A0A1C0YLE5_9BACL|nr:magnesium/cobalt transporter CorA [Caryophanon tenue]OCS87964.1 magnesium and cobalt transport protein CorA [Caryophanon tenue]